MASKRVPRATGAPQVTRALERARLTIELEARVLRDVAGDLEKTARALPATPDEHVDRANLLFALAQRLAHTALDLSASAQSYAIAGGVSA